MWEDLVLRLVPFPSRWICLQEVRPHLSLQKVLCSPHFWMCGVEVKKPDWNKLITIYCGDGKRSVTLPLPWLRGDKIHMVGEESCEPVPLWAGLLAGSSGANLSVPGYQGGCNWDTDICWAIRHHRAHPCLDTERQTGQHHSKTGESLPSQAPHPFIHHRSSIYACSQNSGLSQRDLLGTWSHNLCRSSSPSGPVFLKQLYPWVSVPHVSRCVWAPPGSPLWGEPLHCFHQCQTLIWEKPVPVTLEKEAWSLNYSTRS